MPRLAIVVVASLLAAGCIRTDPPAGDGEKSTVVNAPWWDVGSYWVVDIQRSTGPKESFRLVYFWNDTTTEHFWLGVADRNQARDMALHDDNPLLGRIHHNLLTPHEKGVHAHGLYTFPVEPGDSFSGIAFGRTWQIEASAGATAGQLLFAGTATDRATIAYDYSPATEWFSFIEVKGASGATELRIDVTEHGKGQSGTFYFLRGRDYYAATNPGGTKDETFEVKKEEAAHKSLAIELKGTTSGPLKFDVLDPDGTTRHTETLTSGSTSKIVEISTPKQGTWTMRYIGTGTFTGFIEATGILEYTETLT